MNDMYVAIMAGLFVGLIGLILAYIVYFITAEVCSRKSKKAITAGMHNFRIVTMFGTKVYMDGKELMGVRSIDYHISYDEVPTVKIELYGNVTEFNGQVISKIRGMNVPDRK